MLVAIVILLALIALAILWPSVTKAILVSLVMICIASAMLIMVIGVVSSK